MEANVDEANGPSSSEIAVSAQNPLQLRSMSANSSSTDSLPLPMCFGEDASDDLAFFLGLAERMDSIACLVRRERAECAERLLRPWCALDPVVKTSQMKECADALRTEDANVYRLDFELRSANGFIDSILFDRRLFSLWGKGAPVDELNDVLKSRVSHIIEGGGDEALCARKALLAFGSLWCRLRMSSDVIYLRSDDERRLFQTFSEKRLGEMAVWNNLHSSSSGFPALGCGVPPVVASADVEALRKHATVVSAYFARRHEILTIKSSDSFMGVFVHDVSGGTVFLLGLLLVICSCICAAFSILRVLEIGDALSFTIVILVASVLGGIASTFTCVSYFRCARHLRFESYWLRSTARAPSFEMQWKRLVSSETLPCSKLGVCSSLAEWRAFWCHHDHAYRDKFESMLDREATLRTEFDAANILFDVSRENAQNFIWFPAYACILRDTACVPEQGAHAVAPDAVSSFPESRLAGSRRDVPLASDQRQSVGTGNLILGESQNTAAPVHDELKLMQMTLPDGQLALIPLKTLQRDVIIIGLNATERTVFLWNAAAADATNIDSQDAVGRKISLLMDTQSTKQLQDLANQRRLYEYRNFAFNSRKGGVVTVRARLATCYVTPTATSELRKENRRIILVGSRIEQTDWYPFSYIYQFYGRVLRNQLAVSFGAEGVPDNIEALLGAIEFANVQSRADASHEWVDVKRDEVSAKVKKASEGLGTVRVDPLVDESFLCDKRELFDALSSLMAYMRAATDVTQSSEHSSPIFIWLTQHNFGGSRCLQIRAELMRGRRLLRGSRGEPAGMSRKSLSRGSVLIVSEDDQVVLNLYVPISRHRLGSVPMQMKSQGEGVVFDCLLLMHDLVLRKSFEIELQNRGHRVHVCDRNKAKEELRANSADALFVDDTQLVPERGKGGIFPGATVAVSVSPLAEVSQHDGTDAGWKMPIEFSVGWPALRDRLIKNREHRGLFNPSKESNFKRGAELGRGAAGCVVEYEDTVTHGRVAVKELTIYRGSDIRPMLREIDIMRQFTHQNIVRYITAAHDANSLKIFMEMCDSSLESEIALRKSSGYSLEGNKLLATPNLAHLHEKGLLSLSTICDRIRQVLNGLLFIHNQHVAHRDIKPANILIKSGVVKISDFGSAYSRSTTDTTAGGPKGTAMYMAPEVHTGTSRDRRDASDIWSLGITILEIMQAVPSEIDGKAYVDLSNYYASKGVFRPDGVVNFSISSLFSPFRSRGSDKRERAAMLEVPEGSQLFKAVMEFENDLAAQSPAILDLVWRCLRKDVSDRESALTLLSHPLFDKQAESGADSGQVHDEGSTIPVQQVLDPTVDPFFIPQKGANDGAQADALSALDSSESGWGDGDAVDD